MSNLLSNRTTSEYIVDEEIEPTEPPPPYSEFPTETSTNNNNNEQLTNDYIHNHNSSMPELTSPPHFTQPPLPHPNTRSHFSFTNEYPFPPSVPHITLPNIHLQLPFSQFSHPNVRTPLLPTTYFSMHSPVNESHPFLPSHSRSRRPIERVYSASQRATTRQVFENEDDCCCTAPCEISTWGCLIYLILFSLPFGLFCFTWVITTSIVCCATLILPPLGYIACLIAAASYRMLGRIELVTQQLCGGYPRLFRDLGYQAYPPVFSLDSSFSPLQPQGYFSSSFSYITDAYTWRCLIYFLVIKSFLSIITFIVTVFAVIFSIPLALCLLGPALYLVKTIGVWQKEVAFDFLA
ncbi:hypothetical protein C1645_802184 [Glomus cerebriforme]|uniref:Sensor domain-containing protein n=1 Tax=Glomus cerebriforme TaxID=658196 RepID=A0A397THI1_9GLOM|nr:hypothetical protein C1645_802184 [Glomus cerebriforme]